MLMVGCVVLPGIVFGVGMPMGLIRKHNLLRDMDGTRAMRKRDQDRSQHKRKHKRHRDDKFCRARPGSEDARPWFHVLPVTGVVLSPWGG